MWVWTQWRYHILSNPDQNPALKEIWLIHFFSGKAQFCCSVPILCKLYCTTFVHCVFGKQILYYDLQYSKQYYEMKSICTTLEKQPVLWLKIQIFRRLLRAWPFSKATVSSRVGSKTSQIMYFWLGLQFQTWNLFYEVSPIFNQWDSHTSIMLSLYQWA